MVAQLEVPGEQAWPTFLTKFNSINNLHTRAIAFVADGIQCRKSEAPGQQRWPPNNKNDFIQGKIG